jgi:hypothetical protein
MDEAFEGTSVGPDKNHSLKAWIRLHGRAMLFSGITIALIVGGGAPFRAN